MVRRLSSSGPIARWILTLLVLAGVATVWVTGLQAAAAGEERGFVEAPAVVTSRSLPMFGGPPMVPGERRAGCTVVQNEGGSPARVVLFGRTGGTGLDAHLGLTVLRGSGSCEDFRRDPTDHRGLGAGVLFRGTLRGFPDDPAAALADPATTWEPGEAHAYRFVVRLVEEAPQGLTASQSFVWQTSTP